MRNYALFLILSAAAFSASAAPPDQADGVATVFEDVYVVNGLGDLVTADPRSTLPDADLFTVSGVNLDSGRAVVTMAVDPKYAPLIHPDATLLLRPRTKSCQR